MADEDNRIDQLRGEVDRLTRQLEEARETLEAIRSGEVDAVVINKGGANQVFTLEGADHPYRLFVEEMHQGAVTLSQGSVVLYCNERFAQMIQYPPGQITGTPFDSFLDPASGSAWQALLDRAETGRAETELQLQRRNGSSFPILAAVSATRSAQGPRLVLVVSDLTEQKQHEQLKRAEKELRESQVLLRRIIDGALEAIVVVDDAGRFLEANPAAERMFRVEPDGLIGWDLNRFDGLGNHLENVWQRLQEGASPLVEFQICRAGGALIDAEAYYVPAILPGRHLLVIHDITERKFMEKKRADLEAQIQQVRKAEALAVLTGGVAHDFNNLLTSIIGNASLGSLTVEPGSVAERSFSGIEQAAMRAANLVRQMAAYAGSGVSTLSAVDINILVQEIVLIHGTSLPDHVNLHCQLADPAPMVKGDSTQIFQTLLNLVLNAIEACEAGRPGLVTIRTVAEWVEPIGMTSGTWALPLPPGPCAIVEVSDNGVGMTPEVVVQAFDPFFTTKFIGRGLGLAAVVGIFRGHGGGIWVRSQPGQGSTFRIALPRMDGTMLG